MTAKRTTITTATTKPRTGLAQTLLTAAALLGLSVLILLTSGCARESAPSAEAALLTETETLDAREQAVALAEREIALAEREAALAERETRLATRTVRTDRAPAVPQVVEGFDPIEPIDRPAAAPRVVRQPRIERAVYRSESVTIPAGTRFDVELFDSLSSATAQPGAPFDARVANDVYADGELVIPAGARVSGTVAEAVALRRVGGRAKLVLDFDRVELASGRSVGMNATHTLLGRRETARDAATIGGSAAAGAILGNQVKGRHRDEAKVIGAILGAGVGTAIAHRTRGGEIVLEAGTTIPVSLDSAIHVGARA
jgi:hypothetical protein